MSKPARIPASIAELAAEVGYSPAEFTLRRLAEDIERVSGWIDCLKRGIVPEELGHMHMDQVRELAVAEVLDIQKRERQWIEFFHPKKRAVEAKIEGDVNLYMTPQDAKL